MQQNILYSANALKSLDHTFAPFTFFSAEFTTSFSLARHNYFPLNIFFYVFVFQFENSNKSAEFYKHAPGLPNRNCFIMLDPDKMLPFNRYLKSDLFDTSKTDHAP